MPPAAAEAARTQMVSQVVTPYLIIGSVLIVLALIFVAVKFPAKPNARTRERASR